MFKKVFNIILVLFVLMLFLFGLLMGVINSSWLWKMLVTKSIESRFVNAEISRIDLTAPRIFRDRELLWQKVYIDFTDGEDKYHIAFESLLVKRVNSNNPREDRIAFKMKDFIYTSPDINIDGLNIELNALIKKRNVVGVTGPLTADEISYGDYKMNNVSSNIVIDHRALNFNDFNADFYGGKILGKIILDYVKEITYIMDIDLREISIKKLAVANPALFSQVSGNVDGHINVKGDNQRVKSLSGVFDIVSEASVKASLLRELIGYIPPSTQRNEIAGLLETGGNIPLSKAQVQIESFSEDKIKVRFDLFSEKLNLDLDIPVDINVEGGWMSLFDAWKKISN